MDYEKNLGFFRYEPLSIPVVVVGVVIGLILLSFTPPLAIIVLVIMAAYVYYKLSTKIPDTVIDKAYERGLGGVVNKGLAKLELDMADVCKLEPLVLHGPYYGKYTLKKGWRSSNYEASVLFFGEEKLYLYKYRFSITVNESIEMVEEYLYRDIVSVTTESSNEIDYLKIITNHETLAQCPIRDSKDVERYIKELKQIIRQKKSVSQ